MHDRRQGSASRIGGPREGESWVNTWRQRENWQQNLEEEQNGIYLELCPRVLISTFSL